ncbi:MAG TPA: type II toxin-antitoxin system VapC family toxin [Nonomuraea sp.]|nr:type II toxin-antitoxin system VapC family toxin [Nonomuraea sp.]
MAILVLDSGAVTAFSHADRRLREHLRALAHRSGEPFIVPTTVLIESTTGSAARDARVNAFLHACDVVPLTALIARRAAALRHAARAGSAVDASVIATAEARGGGVVLTGDVTDLVALASRSPAVHVLPLP